MKDRLRRLITNPRVLAILALLIVACLFLLTGNVLKVIGFWLLVITLVVAAIWAIVSGIKHYRARKASDGFSDAVVESDLTVLRSQLRDAIKSIRSSRLGRTRGREALYELPWYMIIGNPAAGKSTAIVNSGLQFPFSEEHGAVIQGIGGTRNCDWYFTSEGILLDTAGRYSSDDDSHDEWLGFLNLLRKHRPRAPVNGIIITASIAELTGNSSEYVVELAKKLRKRVQEITDRLEIIPPVYVLFTKADLIAGFTDFFAGLNEDERNQVWGATLPFKADGNANIPADFDFHFDKLSEGLKETGLTKMAMKQSEGVAPGVLTLPLEFTGIKSTLRHFITTLFEDNPYQYRPVFRGFYFTSAVQDAALVRKASNKITKQFHLASADSAGVDVDNTRRNESYFLLDLFRKVMFADKQLVRQHSTESRRYRRYGILVSSALALGLILGSWAWSYTNNRQLISDVRNDLAHAMTVQQSHVDLASRFKALGILQNRLQQLTTYHKDHPLQLSLGLYQGDEIAAKLRQVYFNGMQEIMLDPVTHHLQAYLANVVRHKRELALSSAGSNTKNDDKVTDPLKGTPVPTNVNQAYNALKAYLMLSQSNKVEPVLLSAQLTRFWRTWLQANQGDMSHEELVRNAQRLMTFYVSQYQQPGWSDVTRKVALVSDARRVLRHAKSGMSAIDRIYAQVKTKASTRYPSVTVASILGKQGDNPLLTGSYAIPGAFTHEAWKMFVKGAFKHAANNELNVHDWVLQSTRNADLTTQASPAEIRQKLKARYVKEYAQQWQHFLKGVAVAPFSDFNDAVQSVNKLADNELSPLRKLLEKSYAETSWDNPVLAQARLDQAPDGLVTWFKRVILRRAPDPISEGAEVVDLSSITSQDPEKAGPIGSHFPGVARLMTPTKEQPALFDDYMKVMDQLQARLDKIQNMGQPGKATGQLMADTLSGKGSELTEGLRLVDDQMLQGLNKEQRNVVRSLLLRPLMQVYKALLPPTEQYLNQAWQASVYRPFTAHLANKYPFDGNASIKATRSELARVFGPSGAIVTFINQKLAPLVNRNGNVLTAKQWASMGVSLSPDLLANYGLWSAPVGSNGVKQNKTVFQVLPGPATANVRSYSININGQKLNYHNQQPEWQSFVWGGTNVQRLTKVEATLLNDKKVTIENFTDAGALGRLFQAADGGPNAQGVYTLTWSRSNVAVTVDLKIISSPLMNGNGASRRGLGSTGLPANIVGTVAEKMANASAGQGGKS